MINCYLFPFQILRRMRYLRLGQFWGSSHRSFCCCYLLAIHLLRVKLLLELNPFELEKCGLYFDCHYMSVLVNLLVTIIGCTNLLIEK